MGAVNGVERARLAAGRPLGATGLEVTSVCVGGAPLGSLPQNFGYEVSEEQGIATVIAAFTSSFRMIDTAAGYSGGESERRIGRAIELAGGLPAGMRVSTKVASTKGRLNANDVRRSVEASLDRLGLEIIDVLHLHDPEYLDQDLLLKPGGAVEELVRLKEQGLARTIGIAGGTLSVMERFVRTGLFDVMLTHNRWTLADRTAGPLIREAAAMGMGVVNAAPFGGGLLARGARHVDTYCYRALNQQTRLAVERVEALCREGGVPLGAAALQFSLRNPLIDSTVVGVSRPERIEQTEQWASWPIPADLWQEIESSANESAGLDD